MFLGESPMPQLRLLRRSLSVLAIASTLFAAVPAIVNAQGLPGLTIFSGVDREFQLGYRLDNGGRTGRMDRYRLRIPNDKVTQAVEQLVVSYPDSFRGRFDQDEIEIRIDGDAIPLDEVNWDQENRVIEIFPTDPVPANTRIEVVMSNVRNPRTAGTHYFNALVRYSGDIPLATYVGTWIIGIGN